MFDLCCVSPLMVEIFNTGVEIILGIRVVCFQIKGGFTLSRNCLRRLVRKIFTRKENRGNV